MMDSPWADMAGLKPPLSIKALYIYSFIAIAQVCISPLVLSTALLLDMHVFMKMMHRACASDGWWIDGSTKCFLTLYFTVSAFMQCHQFLTVFVFFVSNCRHCGDQEKFAIGSIKPILSYSWLGIQPRIFLLKVRGDFCYNIMLH